MQWVSGVHSVSFVSLYLDYVILHAWSLSTPPYQDDLKRESESVLLPCLAC